MGYKARIYYSFEVGILNEVLILLPGETAKVNTEQLRGYNARYNIERFDGVTKIRFHNK
jgi:hypothetical protein